MAMTEPLNNGRFGNFGGMFVPETLIPACQELEKAFEAEQADLHDFFGFDYADL